MSKIAEKKVRELGHGTDPWCRNEYSANDVFDCGVECYDQAVQDFLVKACEWLDNFLYIEGYHVEAREDKIEDFKNYMEDEL